MGYFLNKPRTCMNVMRLERLVLDRFVTAPNSHHIGRTRSKVMNSVAMDAASDLQTRHLPFALT
jgi:hypothetical protein